MIRLEKKRRSLLDMVRTESEKDNVRKYALEQVFDSHN